MGKFRDLVNERGYDLTAKRSVYIPTPEEKAQINKRNMGLGGADNALSGGLLGTGAKYGQLKKEKEQERNNYLANLDTDSERWWVMSAEDAIKEMEDLEYDFNFSMSLYSPEDQERMKARYAGLQSIYGDNAEAVREAWKTRSADLDEAVEFQNGLRQNERIQGWQDKYAGMSYYDLNEAIGKVTDPTEKAWLEQYAPTQMTEQDYSIALGDINTELYKLEKLAESLADDPLNQEAGRLQEMGLESAADVNNRIEELKRQKWQLEHGRDYAGLSQNEDYELMSSFTNSGGGRNFRGVNDSQNFLDVIGRAAVGAYYAPEYDRMTEEEVNNFNYLYQTQGKEAADEYMEYLKPQLDARTSEAFAQGLSEFTSKNLGTAILGNAASVPMNLIGGIGVLDVGAQHLMQDITGNYKPINYNTPGMMPTRGTEAVRGTTAGMITDATGTIQLDEKKHPVLSTILNGRGLADVYQLGMSAIDSRVAALTGNPAVATALLSSSAATSGVLDALERGATDEQALSMGLWNGAFEALFEYIEVDNLLKGDPNWIKAVTNQAITEGLGEGFTSVANNIADGIIMADKSALMQAAAEYESQGLSEREAYRKAFADMMVDIGWDIVGGAASGGLSAGGYSAVGAITSRMQYNALPQQIKTSTERLQSLGMDRSTALDASGQLYKLGQKYEGQRDAFMAAYEPKQDVYQYASDFNTAWEIGRNNGNREYIGKLSLSESQGKIAYELGVAAAKAKSEAATVSPEEKESGYSVSEGGETVSAETGKKITIKGFASVGSDATLDIGGGKTIKAEDVSYADIDEAMLYETVAEVAGSTRNANNILEDYRKAAQSGMSASDYAAALRQTYDLGVSGQVAERQLGNYELAGKLGVGVRSIVFSQGRKRGDYKATAKQAVTQARGRQAKGNRQGTFHFARNGRTFSKTQEASLGALEGLSKALGVDIYIYESYEDGGKRVYQDRSGKAKSAPNGWYDTETGAIHIDLNAGNFGQGTMMFTAAHELTHFIKDWSPVKFRKLADLLVKRYAEQGVSVRDLIDNQIAKAEKNGRTIDRDTAFEEVVADSMETMLTQGDAASFMAELKQQDKTLWEKVRDWFKNLAEKLRGVVDAYQGYTPESPEGRTVAQMEDFIGVLQEAYSEALMDASKNYRANEGKKNTTQEGGEKYQARRLTESDLEAYLRAGTRGNKNKLSALRAGQKIILTSANQIKQFILNAIDKKLSSNTTVAYGKVNDRLADDIFQISKGKIVVNDNYLELIPDNLQHAYEEHHIAKQAGDIDLSRSDFEKIPEYLDSYTEIVYAIEYASGKVGVCVSKRLQNGRVLLIETVSKSRGALQFKNAIGVTESKYQSDYVSVYKNSAGTNTRGSSSSKNSLRDSSNATDIIQNDMPEVKGKFSLREPVEHTKNLVALHNLTEDKLAKTLELGGFPMPSIAITKADIPHTNFGDITLVFGRETVDPKANKKNVVYSADAWTPTFPRTEYEEDQAVGNEIARRLRGLGKKIDDHFQNDLRRVYMDIEGTLNRYNGEEGLIQYALDNYGLKAAYLEEQGTHIEKAVTQVEAEKGFNPASAERYQRIADILGVKTAEEISAYNLKEARDKHGEELEAILPGITKSPIRMSRIFSAVKAYMKSQDNGPVYETVTDAGATRKAVDDALDQAAYEAWVRKLFSGIVKDSGIYNQKELFTPSGNRRSFKQTHLPVTLENIVKAMAAQNGGSTKNVSGFNGIKTLRAGTAERFKSIDAMHHKEGRLQNLTPEELEAINDALHTRLYDIIKAIDDENGGKGSDNSLIRYDTIGEIITEISESGKFNVSDIQQTFRGYGKEISDDTALSLKQLLFDVAQMPVNIFEAKPERVVGLNEVKAAIVPQRTNQKIVDKLRQNGIPVRFYEAGNDTERLTLVNGMEELKFSDRDPTAAATAQELEKQNAKLRQDVKDLRELLSLQGKLTKGTEFRKSSIEAAVKGLAQTAGATLDADGRTQLYDMLKGFYRYIASDENLAWEGVREEAGKIADFLQSNVKFKPQRSDYANDVLGYLRGQRVALSESQRAEVEKLYGYENFRRQLFGAGIYLSKDGISLDSLWHEAAGGDMFPGTFDMDIAEGNQPAELLRVIDGMREDDSSGALEYAYNRDFIRQDLIQAVYDSYWRVDNLHTVADRKQREINEIRRKHNERMDALTASHQQTVNRLKEERRADIQAVREAYRERNARDLQKARERYAQARERGRESRAAASQRQIVEKAARDMMNMLSKPTKDAHVPMALQKPLEKLLNSIDFTSNRAAAGGEPTIRDVAYTRALHDVKLAIAAQRTALEGDGDGTFSLDVPKEFLDQIDAHIKMIQDATEGLDLTTNRVYKMSIDELRDLAYILKTINRAVRQIDKLHMEGAKARVSDLAKDTVWEMGRRKPVKTEDGGAAMWANYTPTFAFERMGGAATQILDGLKQGQAKLARTSDAIIKFAGETYNSKEVKDWEHDIHEIKLESGKTVKMTSAQIMSFYCLSRREQAKGHLNGGGIRMGNIGEGRKEVIQRDHYKLTQNDIAKINGMLTDRQREVANKLQGYMADVGGKLGNEISMARWDYMEMTDKDYFPIRSDSDIHDARNPDQDKANLWGLLNKSFTKAVVKGANDAMIVSSIFDVFANHMSEMAEYNAFALPLVDAMKWYNYRETQKGEGDQITTVGVKKALNDTLGTAAGKYFIDLMTDINSSQKAGRFENFFGKLLSRSKGASVGWNLRVAIQQPTAILRASVYLDPRNLLRGVSKFGSKKLGEEMRKYSGIALWKSLGYYDLNISRGVTDQIKGDTTLLDKMNDWGMWLPGKMDQWTWTSIWAGCKAQVQAEKNLTGEALLRETAKVFDGLVYHTQVADSVLTRSSIMRSKSQTIKELTSFMAEPTMSANLLLSAFQDYREGVTRGEKAKRAMRIAFCGYVLSGLANALITAFADAARDDDEYEGYWEKYFQALFGEKVYDGNLFAELNPLEKIVFVRDILSMLQGYEASKNPFMELVESSVGLLKNVGKFIQGKGSLTAYGLIYQGLQVLGSFTGAAPANMLREVTTIWNNTFGKWNNMIIHRYETDPKQAIRDAYKAGALGKREAQDALIERGVTVTDAYWMVKEWETGNTSKYTDLYTAALNGQDLTAHIRELTENGKTKKEVLSELKSQIGTWYTDPESDTRIDREEAQRMLEQYFDLNTDEIEDQLRLWDMKADTGFGLNDLKQKFLEETVSADDAVRYLVEYGGKTQEDAQERVDEWAFELEHGYSYDDIKWTYLDNEISAQEAKDVLVNRGGKTDAEAERRIQYWEFLRNNRDSVLTEYQVADFYKHAEPAGISAEVYERYIVGTKGIEGEGTKVKKMDVIDSLPLTNSQKDALYFAEGWAKSRLNEAPWH